MEDRNRYRELGEKFEDDEKTQLGTATGIPRRISPGGAHGEGLRGQGRSGYRRIARHRTGGGGAARRGRVRGRHLLRRKRRRGPGGQGRGRSRRRAQGPYLEDRKSTRLNSSHLVISYAVFCLKKKKNDK